MKRPDNKKRRYYLHKMVRHFTTVKSLRREVIVSDKLLQEIGSKQKEYLEELRDQFGYNIQYTLA